MISCHHDQEDKQILNHKKYDLEQAATYNTQLGLAYLKQGDRSRAKRKLLLALEQAPNSANANAAMAYFLENSGEVDEAQSRYLKAMSLAPGNGAQLNNYGTFLCRQGNYQQAESYFLKAVNDKKYENTSGAYENAGLCVLAMPDASKAATYFAKALAVDPERKQSLYELLSIHLKKNQAKEALTYIQKYPNLVLEDKTLLALAVEASRQSGNQVLALAYQKRLDSFLDNTGVKNDDNNDNG